MAKKDNNIEKAYTFIPGESDKEFNGCTKPHHRKSGKQWVLTY